MVASLEACDSLSFLAGVEGSDSGVNGRRAMVVVLVVVSGWWLVSFDLVWRRGNLGFWRRAGTCMSTVR